MDEWRTRHSLIQRLVHLDDNKDWEDFTKHFRPFIVSIIIKMRVNISDHDDLVQDILIKLHENLKTYMKEKGRFHSWLATVIRNTVKNFLNKQSRLLEKNEKYADALKTFNSYSDSEVDKTIQTEWKSYLITKALNRLEEVVSENVLTCFKLTLDKVPVEEIAERLNIKVETVYITRNRMKARMQIELKELMNELEF